MKLSKTTRTLASAGAVASIAASALFTALPANAATTSVTSPLKAKSYSTTSTFGPRCAYIAGGGTYHYAQDLAAADGTPIYAIADGTVIQVLEPANGNAATILIQHTINGKNVISGYTHMWKAGKYVKLGQKVKKGQHIADVGSSGASTGPHLHFSIRLNNTLVDPVPYMKSIGIDLKKNANVVYNYTLPSVCNYYSTSRQGLLEKPKLGSKTIAILGKDEKLTSKPGAANGMYVQVTTSKGKTGWVNALTVGMEKSFEPAALPSNTKNVAVGTQYTVAASLLNFRSYPTTSRGMGGILYTLPLGTKVVGTGKVSGTWTQVKYGNETGWMSTASLKKVATPVAVKTRKVNEKLVLKANVKAYASYSTSSASVSLSKGKAVTGTGYTYGSWVQILDGKTKRWVQSASSLHAAPVKNVAVKSYAVKNTTIKAYANYFTDSKATTLKKGTKVSTTGYSYDSWRQIQVGSKKYWITNANQLVQIPVKTASAKTYVMKANTKAYASYSTKSKAVTLKKFAKVTTTGYTYDKWAEIKVGSKKSWITNPSQLTSLTKKVSANLNFRKGAGTKYSSIKVLKKNSSVTLAGKVSGSWVQVKYGSKTGWVSSAYLK